MRTLIPFLLWPVTVCRSKSTLPAVPAIHRAGIADLSRIQGFPTSYLILSQYGSLQELQTFEGVAIAVRAMSELSEVFASVYLILWRCPLRPLFR